MAEKTVATLDEFGNVTFPDDFKPERVKTVLVVLPDKGLFNTDILRRLIPILPNDTAFDFSEVKFEFNVVPDGLIRDVTNEMKGGD